MIAPVTTTKVPTAEGLVSPIDLRTRAGRREEVLEQIRDYGGFSIFWVTENHLRACVAQDMQDSGEIITDNKTHGFPWIGAKISKLYAHSSERYGMLRIGVEGRQNERI